MAVRLRSNRTSRSSTLNTASMDVDLAQWTSGQLKRLVAQPISGYAASGNPAAEPVAMSALTAIAHGKLVAAETACRLLSKSQQRSGSVSVWLDDAWPFWPTSLACVAWKQFEMKWPENAKSWCRDAYERGTDFLLSTQGETLPQNKDLGHNTELVGWPWVESTHSWLEPTAMALMALRHCGHQSEPRAVEAMSLLLDRQLPEGGANYGNTFVLGQKLRPHILPSAMTTVALHGVIPVPDPLRNTLKYLRSELNRPMAATSLAWTITALVSSQWEKENSFELEFEQPIRSAVTRLIQSGENPYRQNLLLLAMSYRESPLLKIDTNS